MGQAQATDLAGSRIKLQREQPNCPDCRGPLVRGEGRVTCPVCGYSREEIPV